MRSSFLSKIIGISPNCSTLNTCIFVISLFSKYESVVPKGRIEDEEALQKHRLLAG